MYLKKYINIIKHQEIRFDRLNKDFFPFMLFTWHSIFPLVKIFTVLESLKRFFFFLYL